ncbi:hypothetical protein AB1Y20_003420 [Prymnesium parvum]|uniref:Phosphoinositide phospholipase C n=1 Tax=Prymnesium parvum TaxID=97485 RepID=A0AB34JE53_PRYPA
MGLLALIALANLALVSSEGQSYGRALSCRDIRSFANTRVTTFAGSSSTKLEEMAEVGITISLWSRYLFAAQNPSPITVNHKLAVVYFAPFSGDTGFFANNNAEPTMALVADTQRWHHYAVSFDVVTEQTNWYVDGKLVGSQLIGGGRIPVEDDMKLTLCASCSVANYLNPYDYTSCVASYSMFGEIDDVAVWGRPLSHAEIEARWNSSLTARLAAGVEPDLLFFYNFNNASAAEHGVVPNLGQLGGDFDLLLGQSSGKAFDEHRFKYVEETSGEVLATVAPALIPAGEVSRQVDPDAVLIVVLTPSETAWLRAPDGTPFNVTAPALFTDTVHRSVVVGSQLVVVELQPALAPTVLTEPSLLIAAVIEDVPTAIPLRFTSPDGMMATAFITSLPTRGALYHASSNTDFSLSRPISTVGQVNSSRSGYWVVYQPLPNDYGVAVDSFSYQFVSDKYALASGIAKVTINIEPIDDLPSAQPETLTLEEDSSPEGIAVTLHYRDYEPATPVAAVVSRLPSKGSLYINTSNSLRAITTAYNIFDVGTTLEQYLSKIISVSSFWGGPPYAGYHPLTLLGPPDSSAYGEGDADALWVRDVSVAPPIGQRALHQGLVVFVRAIAGGDVTIEFAKMYKRDGTGAIRQCHIPVTSSKVYPNDCAFELVPESGVVTAVVPRESISGMGAGVWSPLMKGYVGNVTVSGGLNAIAYGEEYAFTHNQFVPYNSESRFTEFVEAQIEQPVYVIAVEIGSPRGMGAVTRVQMKRGDEWVSLYQGNPLVAVNRESVIAKQYWRWSPLICRTHFKTREIRIELDTSAETGIGDWNYLDYVKIIGSLELQPAALPHGVDSLVYVPDLNAYGSDSFDYESTDCPGDFFRFSPPAKVDITLTANNDAPVVDETLVTRRTVNFRLGSTLRNISFPVFDVDSNSTELRLESLPRFGRFTAPGMSPGKSLSPEESYVFEVSDAEVASAVELQGTGDEEGSTTISTEVTYTATDPLGSKSLLTLEFHVPVCLAGYGARYNIEADAYECLPCDSGSVSSLPSLSGCSRCPVGFVQPVPGQVECTPCLSGFYAPREGMSVCDRCDYPTGSLPGKASCDVCTDNLYLSSSDECLPCPRGAECPANTTLESLVLKPGFWRLSPLTAQIHSCKGLDSENASALTPCLGGAGVGECQTNHTGPLCETCKDGFYFEDSTCQECASAGGAAGVAIGVSIAALVVCRILFALARKSPLLQIIMDSANSFMIAFQRFGGVAKLKIAIAFLQIYIAIPQLYLVEVPDQYSSAMRVFSWLNVDLLALYPSKCISDSYESTVNIATLVSLALPLGSHALVVLYVVAMHETGAGKRHHSLWSAARHGFVQGVPVSLFWVYLLVVPASRRLFSVWDCKSYEQNDETGEKAWFLVQDTSVLCNLGDSVSAEHQSLTTLATGYLFIWPVGVPLLFFFITFTQRHTLRNAEVTEWSVATRVVHREYKKEMFYWESFELLRRLTLSGFLLLVPRTLGIIQLIFAVIISLLSFCALFIFSPYRRADDNMLAIAANLMLLMAFFASIFIRTFTDFAEEVGKEVTGKILGYNSSFEISMVMLATCFAFTILIVGSLVKIFVSEHNRAKGKAKAEDDRLIHNALKDVTVLHHPCVFMKLYDLIYMQKFTDHEALRDSGKLLFIDNYDALTAFTRDHVTVFLSHEWLGLTEPDPTGIQFRAAVRACCSLAAREGVSTSDFYIWLDYSSVPQQSVLLMQLAINTLSAYAGACKYFLVVAPEAKHETGRECSHKTYSRRGWCRLEQFSRMSTGIHDMYIATDAPELIPLDVEFLREASFIFEGDFTVQSDRKKLVPVVLGVWALIVNSTLTDPDSPHHATRALIEQDIDRIFPAAEFRRLPEQIVDLLMRGEVEHEETFVRHLKCVSSRSSAECDSSAPASPVSPVRSGSFSMHSLLSRAERCTTASPKSPSSKIPGFLERKHRKVRIMKLPARHKEACTTTAAL